MSSKALNMLSSYTGSQKACHKPETILSIVLFSVASVSNRCCKIPYLTDSRAALCCAMPSVCHTLCHSPRHALRHALRMALRCCIACCAICCAAMCCAGPCCAALQVSCTDASKICFEGAGSDGVLPVLTLAPPQLHVVLTRETDRQPVNRETDR